MILSIHNFKGGTGKTTITFNLAYELNQAGYRVLVIDFSHQVDLTRSLLKDTDQPNGYYTIFDVLENNIDVWDVIQESNKHVCYKIDIIPSSKKMISLPMLAERRRYEFGTDLNAVFNTLENKYDIIIIDHFNDIGGVLLECLRSTDYVLIPVKDIDSINNCTKTIAMSQTAMQYGFRDNGITFRLIKNRMARLINGIGSNEPLGQRDARLYLEQKFSKFLLNSYIPETTKFDESRIYGIPIQKLKDFQFFKILLNELLEDENFSKLLNINNKKKEI